MRKAHELMDPPLEKNLNRFKPFGPLGYFLDQNGKGILNRFEYLRFLILGLILSTVSQL